ncbi:MAG: hypothetical protein FIB08_13765 [Candidatus Methanoperedens sp.]|nr:hypothetical protein [Candidatus Methanoperedens sp.]
MTKIVITVIILLLLSVLLSGCTGKKNASSAPDSIQKEEVNVSFQNITRLQEKENMPEISITSFSSVYMHDNLEQKDVYLFGWENVPGNESHRLLVFLRDYHGINWTENATITKDDERKIIRVSANGNAVEIMLYDEGARMTIGEISYHDMWVKEENGTHNLYNKIYRNIYDISARYYAAYNLSIKNNGSTPVDFKLTRMHLREGDRIFNITTAGPYGLSLLEVLEELDRESKMQDTILLPDQILNGSVVFRVDSLYNESFLLMYDATPVTSASFEKSIDALRAAERFDYSVALGVPPYSDSSQRGRMTGSYEPDFDDCCNAWANWMDREIFEVFKKSDVERMLKSPPDSIPVTRMVYALKIMPEKNITMFPVTTRLTNHLLVINDAGNEIINTSDVQHRTIA